MRLYGDPVSIFLYAYGVNITAFLGLIASVLALSLVRPWGRKVPLWILILPAAAGGAAFIVISLSTVYKIVTGIGDGTFYALTGPFSSWVLLPVYGGFAVWGVTISMAAWSYYKGMS